MIPWFSRKEFVKICEIYLRCLGKNKHTLWYKKCKQEQC
jgi:hypothetical protein